jgi:hypothetical protein
MDLAHLHLLEVVQGVAIWTSFAESLTESQLKNMATPFLKLFSHSYTILHVPLSFMDLATITV